MKRNVLLTSRVGLGSFMLGASLFAGQVLGDSKLSVTEPMGVQARQLAEGAESAEKKEDKGEKIELDKLPKKVSDSVKKQIPGAKLTKASKKAEDGKTVYFLDDVKEGKKEWDLKVAEDGTILKKEECHDD